MPDLDTTPNSPPEETPGASPTPVPPGRPSGWSRLGGAILFYTRLPLPPRWEPSFEGIAAFAPLVGAGIGGLLTLADLGLSWAGVPPLTRSALVVGLWVWVTGGLHLDGAMDTADGLAVPDPQRRLAVMADSRTGAFGTMAAIAILGLKTLALADLTSGRGGVLVLAALGGRWGQGVAIARYPYLKAEGKGALHKLYFRLPQDLLMGPVLAGVIAAGWGVRHPEQLPLAIGSAVGGGLIAIALGAWLNRCLGGHTGDTYGAVVEWTETFVLCLGTVLWGS